jgi:hypothetical protein
MVSFWTPGFLIIVPFFRIRTQIAVPQKLSCTNKMKLIPYASNTTFRFFIKKIIFKNVIYRSLQAIATQYIEVQTLIETFNLKLVGIKRAIQTN